MVQQACVLAVFPTSLAVCTFYRHQATQEQVFGLLGPMLLCPEAFVSATPYLLLHNGAQGTEPICVHCYKHKELTM